MGYRQLKFIIIKVVYLYPIYIYISNWKICYPLGKTLETATQIGTILGPMEASKKKHMGHQPKWGCLRMWWLNSLLLT